MKKIDSLRRALADAVPELRGSPDALRVWIERGTARSRQTEERGFAFEFRLNVLLVEIGTDIAIIAHVLFEWLRKEQPDLLAPQAQGFSFDADILDNGTADILIEIELSQEVRLIGNAAGGYDMDYLSEPDPMFSGDVALAYTVPPLTDVDVLE